MPVNRAGSLTGRRVLAVVGAVLACALIWTATAAAESFTVNSTADDVDAIVGNEFCETAAGKCTLRAAIEEANFTSGEDAIGFEEGVFEGDGDSVIAPASPLPTIAAPLSLSGRRCETEAGVTGPCVEIEAESDDVALSVDGADGVLVESLAFTGAAIGLDATESAGLWVKESWFGFKLDGSLAGGQIGIRLGDGADRSRIGGEGPEAGNLIADNAIGLDVHGASGARILGNRFGVTPAGIAAASNGINLAISSNFTSTAINNTVGTRVNPSAAESAPCDGGCNLISAASSGAAIEVAGNGGDRLPPIGTTIAGNQIGFDATGSGGLPNAALGIFVAAPNTVIGGSRAGDANRISGGTVAVKAVSGSPYLRVSGNLIGSRAGADALAPTQAGISIDSTGLLLPVEEAVVLDNEIGLDGGTGISTDGPGGEVSGNLVAGAATGIEVGGEGSENRIDSNQVEATEVGILVEGLSNFVTGNVIGGGQKTGVRIAGSGLFGVSGNVVGGDTAAAENTIDDSTGDAIEIENPRMSLNEVARNRGAGNGDLFIDLSASDADPGDPEPGPPNGGIPPPAIAEISETGAAGFAEPGATVRVFRKATPALGEIASFLGQATADEGGIWSIAYPAPLSIGTAIAATQTLGGGTSELEIATVPPPNGGQRPLAAEAPVDRKPPRTRMLRQPRQVPEGGVARFSFTSNEPGSRFQCRLDGGKYRTCKSPKKYRGLRPGKHVFRVRAIDPAGNADRSPVRRRFEVLG